MAQCTIIAYRKKENNFVLEDIVDIENLPNKLNRSQIIFKGNWEDNFSSLLDKIYDGTIIGLSRRDFYRENNFTDPIEKKYHLINSNHVDLYTDFDTAFRQFFKIAS